jgi:hypothetical protein
VSDPLPAPLFEALRAFLRAGKTGQVVVNVNAGRVESYDVREHCRVPAAAGDRCPRPDMLHCGRTE